MAHGWKSEYGPLHPAVKEGAKLNQSNGHRRLGTESLQPAAEDRSTPACGEPKVSVLVLTYNHEKYIEQALEGALRQKTRFEYEIVAADDCSCDQTAEKIRAVARAHPGRLRLLPRPRNLGIVGNFADAYAACRGQYVAILEGDDVWYHPHKLQRQANVLDRRKRCSFVFHNVRLLFEDGRELDGCCPPHLKACYQLLDFVANNYVPNCSAVMFRHRLVPAFPAWFFRLSYYDWPLHILHLQRGPAAYLSETLSTYRTHHGSAWHGASKTYQVDKLLEIFREINEHLDFRYDSILRLNGNFWRLHLENEQLRQRIQEVEGRLHETESQRIGLLRSRSYKLARVLAGVRHLPGYLRRRAA
jgi:glycosyltransferase involved in cell wall biosynthesis